MIIVGYESYGWPMAFLGNLATYAGKLYWVRATWLANGIPEEIGYLCSQREMGMSSVWLANGIPREIGYLCLQIETDMSYEASY